MSSGAPGAETSSATGLPCLGNNFTVLPQGYSIMTTDNIMTIWERAVITSLGEDKILRFLCVNKGGETTICPTPQAFEGWGQPI